VVGIVAAVAISIAAPYLAGAFLAVIGTTTATALAISVTTALIGVALSIGLSLAFRALGVGAPSAKNAVGPPQVFRQAITNSFIVYGKRRVGGLLVFFHPRTSGSDHFRYFVIACAGHRCQGVVSWMLGDEIVTVNGSNMVTSGKYANSAWLWFQRGLASETANATFVSECGGKWTTNHKGNGIAAIYAKFKMTDAVVEAGMPNITAIIEGRDEILDTRTATTGYSRNAALIFYDWMAIAREEGGFGAYDDEIPDDTWINAQANVCDETVNAQPRYAIDAVITTGAAPAEIRDVMIVNCAGSYTYSGGKHLMRPGYWVPVTSTLSEDDLAGPIQVSPFSTADAAANEVQGTYISPTDKYQGAPLSTQTISPAPTDIRQVDVDLAFTTNKDQGDRILKIMLNRAQAEKGVVWPMNIAGLGIKALDTVQLDSARYGLSNYAWSVANWGLSADWGVVLQLREENEEIYGAPSVVAPPTVPVIDAADPIVSVADTTALIRNSGTANLMFAVDASGNFTISDHTRIYDDKTVSVDGTPGTAADGTGGTPITAKSNKAIQNNVNTTVTHLGSDVYEVEKTAGGTGWNADAVSALSASGDFILRITPGASSGDSVWGVNADPLTNSHYTGIDWAWGISGATAYTYNNGVAGATVAFDTYLWLERIGTNLYFRTGPTAGTLVRTEAGVTGALYFDSSLYLSGSKVQVLFSATAVSGELVFFFYDDPARAGGTVTYDNIIISPGGDDSEAYATPAHPYRHFVLYAVIPGTGSTGGGGSIGSGGGGAGAGGGAISHL
jgi:hypothetical protein